MRVSVILCTFNRCQYLRKALDSVAGSEVSKGVEWEVLIVDNNSSDQTPEVAKGFVARYPGRFRYLFEPKQGKSYALNTGIRESRGDVIAFLDDDVTVEPMWIQNLTSVLRDGEWAGSGGRVLPTRGFSPPRWLALDGPRSLSGMLCAQFDLGDMPCELRDAPYGTNMAFRRPVFDKYGDFRTDLGPRPGSEMRSEDTEFGRRLMAGGERLCYVPSAVVYHVVPENRVKKEFFLAWWFDRGRAFVREAGRGCAMWKIPQIVGRTLPTTLRWALTLNPQHRFYRKCMIWFAAGKVVEIYCQSRTPKAT